MKGKAWEPGEIHNGFKVLEYDREKHTWKCICPICGKTFWRSTHYINTHHQCPDCIADDKQKEMESYIGKRFGDLEVIDFAGYKPAGKDSANVATMLCRCKCGGETEIPLKRLLTGGATSCITCNKKNLEIGREMASELSKKYHTIPYDFDENRKTNKNNTGGVRGVSWAKKQQKWRATISFRRKQYELGFYDNIEDAAKARQEAEKRIYGNFLDWYHKQESGSR